MILDAIERVTGFDLDGDGTVAGDIVCEVLAPFTPTITLALC